MKKIVIPIIALLLVASLAACKGNGDEIPYTGDFSENSSSSLPSESMNISSEPTSDSTASSTVLVALTTMQGETVEVVTTTEPLTAPPTIDYDPVDIPTSMPPINTTYVDQTTYNPFIGIDPYSSTSSTPESTTEATETTTEVKETWVSVNSTETMGDYSDTKITLFVEADKFGTKMKKTKGSVIINFGTTEYKASCTVEAKPDDDDNILIVIDTPSALVDALETSDEETPNFNIEVPKGLIVSEDNVKNNAFTSCSIYY